LDRWKRKEKQKLAVIFQQVGSENPSGTPFPSPSLSLSDLRASVSLSVPHSLCALQAKNGDAGDVLFEELIGLFSQLVISHLVFK